MKWVGSFILMIAMLLELSSPSKAPASDSLKGRFLLNANSPETLRAVSGSARCIESASGFRVLRRMAI